MFRFTIRDLLWLMVVVGMGFGWWLDHRRVGLAPDQLQTLIDILASHGLSVELRPEGVQAETVKVQKGSFRHYQAFGTGVIERQEPGGLQSVEHPPPLTESNDD